MKNNDSAELIKPAIGLFNDSYPPLMDGVAVAVYNYAYWLTQKGEEVKVVTPKVPDAVDNEKFEVYRYASLPMLGRRPYRFGMPYVDVPLLHKVFMKTSFKLVHAHCPFSSGYLAMITASAQKVPFVATFHSKFRDDFERATGSREVASAMLKVIMPMFEAADEVWIPQASVEETIREYGFKGRVEVVNNGTDLFAEGSVEEVKQRAKARLGLPTDKLTLLFVGQHIWEKNTKLIIEALDLLHDVDYQMYFIGTGYAADDMKAMVTERHLDNKITFMGNINNRDLLKTYYGAADLFLFPSLYDNAPLVVREAAALYTPSLIVAGSTSSEVIADNQNGFLVQHNTPESLAERIRQVVAQPQLLNQVAMGAAQTIAQSWESIVGEVLDRYNHLIARK